MVKVNLNNVELNELRALENPKQRVRSIFPIFAPQGALQTTVVYFELDPGEELGTHTDSAEEQIYIIEGKLEGTVGNETGNVSAGDLLLVPVLVPHNFKNTGNVTAKVLGFFGGANNITSVFENTWFPLGLKVVNTEMLIPLEKTAY